MKPPLLGPHLDPAAWVALAEEFDRRDRIYGAAYARRRLDIFKEILADEEGQESPNLPHVVKPDELE